MTEISSPSSVPALHHDSTATEIRGALPGLSQRVTRQLVGGCTCMTKTPELRYHHLDCKYRVMAEVSAVLDAVVSGRL